MKMIFHVFIFIGVQISVFVSAKSSPWNDDDQNNFLREAGCGKFGKLLDIGVCTNYGYRPQITPRVQNSTLTNIYTTVTYQRVRDVNDKKGKDPASNYVHASLLFCHLDQYIIFLGILQTVLAIVEIDLQLTMRWTDPGIETEPNYTSGVSLSLDQVDSFWIPDFYVDDLSDYKSFRDSIQVTTLRALPENLFHENETMIEYEIEAKAKVYCKFELSRYPMDDQKCLFRFGSQANDVRFVLYDSSQKFHRNSSYEAIEYEVNILYPDFTSSGEEAENAFVGFDIKMDRILSPFLFKYYLPSFAIVTASSISFIIPLTAIPGRVAFMVTQFLTLTNLFIYQMVSKSILAIILGGFLH